MWDYTSRLSFDLHCFYHLGASTIQPLLDRETEKTIIFSYWKIYNASVMRMSKAEITLNSKKIKRKNQLVMSKTILHGSLCEKRDDHTIVRCCCCCCYDCIAFETTVDQIKAAMASFTRGTPTTNRNKNIFRIYKTVDMGKGGFILFTRRKKDQRKNM